MMSKRAELSVVFVESFANPVYSNLYSAKPGMGAKKLFSRQSFMEILFMWKVSACVRLFFFFSSKFFNLFVQAEEQMRTRILKRTCFGEIPMMLNITQH